MLKYLLRKRATSTIEYTLFIVILLGALLFMQKFIVRTFGGRWKDAGSVFSQGSQYYGGNTIECIYSTLNNVWCEKAAYRENYWECYTDYCMRDNNPPGGFECSDYELEVGNHSDCDLCCEYYAAQDAVGFCPSDHPCYADDIVPPE